MSDNFRFKRNPREAAELLRRFGVSEETIERVVEHVEQANIDLQLDWPEKVRGVVQEEQA